MRVEASGRSTDGDSVEATGEENVNKEVKEENN